MKFIFPRNYNYNMKLLGFISYTTALIDIIIGIIILGIVNLIFDNISLKIYFFIGLFLPILLFSIFGINKESFVDVVRYIFRFIKNRRVYLYDKTKSVKTNK